MCDPVTIMMAASAVSAVGAISGGIQANNAAKYNATVLEQQAATTRNQGLAREELQRAQARQHIGTQLASTAQSGVALDGSAVDNLQTSMLNAEMDALNIRYERDLNATGLLSQANITRFQGKKARTAGYLSAAGSLMNGASGYLNGAKAIPNAIKGPPGTDGSWGAPY